VEAGARVSVTRAELVEAQLLKTIGRLAASNGIGQAILLVSMALLARMYGPAQFGVYGAMLAFGSMFTAVATLQMHLALVLPQHDEVATDLLRIGVAATCGCALVGGLCGVLVGKAIWGTSDLLVTVCCAGWAAVSSLSRLYQGWFTRKGEFAAVSLWAVIRAAAIVAAQLALGLRHVAGGLVLGALVGEITALAYLVSSRHTPALSRLCRVGRPQLLGRRVVEFRDFAVVGTVQEFISTASFSMPLLIINSAYTTAVGGQFAMAQRLVWTPVAMLGGAMAQVIYHRLALAERSELRQSPALRVGRWAAPALAAGIVAAASMRHMFPLLLGRKWAPAGDMAGYLVLWGVAFLAAVPYRVCYRVLRLQHLQLLVDLCVLGAFLSFLGVARVVAPATLVRLLVVVGLLQNLGLSAIIRSALRGTTAEARRRSTASIAPSAADGSF
jgi:O-antigen/teichoic acid export membrane protein